MQPHFKGGPNTHFVTNHSLPLFPSSPPFPNSPFVPFLFLSSPVRVAKVCEQDISLGSCSTPTSCSYVPDRRYSKLIALWSLYHTALTLCFPFIVAWIEYAHITNIKNVKYSRIFTNIKTGCEYYSFQIAGRTYCDDSVSAVNLLPTLGNSVQKQSTITTRIEKMW